MRQLFAALALVLAASGAGPCVAQARPGEQAAQIDPATLALAQEVVDLAFPPEQRHAMFSRVLDTMMVQVRTAAFASAGGPPEPGALQILDRYFERVRVQADQAITRDSPALFAAFARAYARMFTRDELVQIRAFVATPAGAKYILRSADLLSDPDVAEANTAYMTNAFDALAPLQADLMRELREYRAHHGDQPPAPPVVSHH